MRNYPKNVSRGVEQVGFENATIEVVVDHIQLLVKVLSEYSPSEAVQIMKNMSARSYEVSLRYARNCRTESFGKVDIL